MLSSQRRSGRPASWRRAVVRGGAPPTDLIFSPDQTTQGARRGGRLAAQASCGNAARLQLEELLRVDTKTYESLGLHRSMSDEPGGGGREVNGRSNREIQGALSTPGDRQYHLNPEAFPAEGTPRGSVRSHRDWA